MFDIFGIRKRREEKRRREEVERQARIQEEKRRYQGRKKLICDYLTAYREEESRKNSEDYAERQKLAEEKNSKCPKCGSTNIVNHIRRTKGEIHGSGHVSGHSSHYSGLFSSSSSSYLSGHSKIDGKLDTLPVNRCNDCGNEWMIEEAKYESPFDIFSTYSSHYPDWLFLRLDSYFELTYDPDDITDECNSLKEKREKYISDIASNKYYFPSLMKTMPRYMFDYMLYKAITHWHYREENVDEGWGFSEDVDEFSYQMPDALWDIVKRMINWTGPEETKPTPTED